MGYERELEAALRAVSKASRLCRNVQDKLVGEDTLAKEDRSPVTIADLGSQGVVCLELAEAFPDDPVVGEEDTSLLRENADLSNKVLGLVLEEFPGIDRDGLYKAIERGGGSAEGNGRYWTVDPIDGTKGFLRGDQYAVALALIVDGEVVVGVLGCPNLSPSGGDPREKQGGALFSAVAGAGAFVHPLDGSAGSAIRVDGQGDPSEARFCESVESGHGAHDTHARISAHLGIKSKPYRIDSQCKYAAVARGDASIYLRLPTRKGYEERIWDHAAGVIVVREAGGVVSDMHGRKLDFRAGETLKNNRGIVVSNGALHDALIDAIGKVVIDE